MIKEKHFLFLVFSFPFPFLFPFPFGLCSFPFFLFSFIHSIVPSFLSISLSLSLSLSRLTSHLTLLLYSKHFISLSCSLLHLLSFPNKKIHKKQPKKIHDHLIHQLLLCLFSNLYKFCFSLKLFTK